MGVNLVIVDGNTKIDLTTDTVTAGTLKKGETAHNSAGDVITGTLEPLDTSDATATAAQILKGSTAYVNGSKVTGTMPNIGKQNIYVPEINVWTGIIKGYHDGTGAAGINPDEAAKLTSANVRSGVTVLGVTGTLKEADLTIERETNSGGGETVIITGTVAGS